MSNKRRVPSPNEHIALVAQVDGLCPVCADPLLYDKRTQLYKGYEVAHIYPLNPTKMEKELLKSEERLSTDVNNRANMIPLCVKCHTRFDQPRTVAEYRNLVKCKRKAERLAADRAAYANFRLEDDVADVVMRLLEFDTGDTSTVSLDPKAIDDKADQTLRKITKDRIRRDVRDYYSTVQALFREREAVGGASATLIAAEVKAFYESRKNAGHDQQDAYEAVVDWIAAKTSGVDDAIRVVAAFFVQNCEVLG